MRGDLSKIIAIVCVVLYNALVFSIVAYVVFEKGYSGWWFLLVALFMENLKITTDETTD